MSLNDAPKSERIHIGFFGKTNAGKSSVINKVTSQNLSIVSDIKGTTTDPVLKSMELLPIGPVVIIDTPGLDDKTDLGKMRIEKTNEILRKTDIAVIVIDANDNDENTINLIKERNIPYIICYNKCDIKLRENLNDNEICVSAKTGENIEKLKELIASKAGNNKSNKKIVSDILNEGDIALLVIPIDESAPKGRLILPQQQTIRDLLDGGNMCICVKDTELEQAIKAFKDKVKIVITDSQAFKKVAKIVPDDILLTSFSILFMRYKGELDGAVKSVKKLDTLSDGDVVLISEGCSHHRQCNDIGTVKMPNWIKEYTKKDIKFEFTSGGEFPLDLSKYSLVVHCGGCMLNETEMKNRINIANDQNVPITNYGITIAHINGILERSIKPFI
ncbi:MAG: [FeFe] hydrogenase H-cluster maturation GTPase HydF [Ruminococcaceae bacterium]|nr:[FeFe] hydrogenase H-cluster maturation GTPase HydF [Oscillospiraceae bacterium]